MMVSSHTDKESLSAKLRRKRMRFLDAAIDQCGSQEIALVDLGGTLSFWEMNLRHLEHAGRIRSIDVYNLEPEVCRESISDGVTLRVMRGDVTCLPMIEDRQYDVAFSNSVIEHVGNLHQQSLFAREIQRIAPRFVLQTPNRYFPLEPHFYVPFFPFMPLGFKAFLHRHFRLGWLAPEPDPLQARIDCDQIRLLSCKELKLLFPMAEIQREWLAGMVKSFVLTGSQVV